MTRHWCALAASPDALDAHRRGPHRRMGLQPRHGDRPRHRHLRPRPPRHDDEHADPRRRRPRLLGRRDRLAPAPGEYGAIHFHRDDLEDAGWEADFELTIPADLPSGIYAAWLRAGDDEDYLPFTVRPPRGTTAVADRRADVDGDLRDLRELHRHRTRGLARGRLHGRRRPPSRTPTRRSSAMSIGYVAENSLYGTYDVHEDGSGVVLRLDAAPDPQHAPEVPLPDARRRRRASRPTSTRSTGWSRRASRSTT